MNKIVFANKINNTNIFFLGAFVEDGIQYSEVGDLTINYNSIQINGWGLDITHNYIDPATSATIDMNSVTIDSTAITTDINGDISEVNTTIDSGLISIDGNIITIDESGILLNPLIIDSSLISIDMDSITIDAKSA